MAIRPASLRDPRAIRLLDVSRSFTTPFQYGYGESPTVQIDIDYFLSIIIFWQFKSRNLQDVSVPRSLCP